jgi:hypothetical protein
MDVIVRPTAKDTWTLTDRLGRALGKVIEVKGAGFRIQPGNKLLSGADPKTFDSLNLAMLEIERQAKGACQLAASQ